MDTCILLFSNLFFATIRNGLASNTRLLILNLVLSTNSKRGNLTAIMLNGLHQNTSLEDISLNVGDLNKTKQLMSGIDQMGAMMGTKRLANGLYHLSTLKRVHFHSANHRSIVERANLILACLVGKKDWFILEELCLDCCFDDNDDIDRMVLNIHHLSSSPCLLLPFHPFQCCLYICRLTMLTMIWNFWS